MVHFESTRGTRKSNDEKNFPRKKEQFNTQTKQAMPTPAMSVELLTNDEVNAMTIDEAKDKKGKLQTMMYKAGRDGRPPLSAQELATIKKNIVLLNSNINGVIVAQINTTTDLAKQNEELARQMIANCGAQQVSMASASSSLQESGFSIAFAKAQDPPGPFCVMQY